MSRERSAEWHALHGEQLDLRRQLAEDPAPEEKAVLIERFRSNRETIAAIERGEESSVIDPDLEDDDHGSPERDPHDVAFEVYDRDDLRFDEREYDEIELGGPGYGPPEHHRADATRAELADADLDIADDLDLPDDLDVPRDLDVPGDADDDGHLDPDERSVFEHWDDLEPQPGVPTTELVAVRARPTTSDNTGRIQISPGSAALVGLVALIVAIGGVLVVGQGTQRPESTAGRAGGGSEQLASTAVDLEQQAQLLRTRLDELGIGGISIGVDNDRSVILLTGSVASEGERQQVVDAAQNAIGAAGVDTSNVVLAGSATDDDGPAATPVPTVPVRRVAVITPGPRSDFAFSQSMTDSIEAVATGRGNLELTVVDEATGADAVDAIRRHAADGFDLVIAHSSGFRPTVYTIAAQYPDVAFAVGTILDEPTLPNVYTYNVAVEEGGAILGAAAARASTTGVIGVVGPVPAGTSKRYLDAFEAAVKAEAPEATVIVAYTGSLDDSAAAAASTRAMIEAGADVIAGQGNALAEAVAVAEAAGVLWIGNGVDQAPLGPSTVLGSQVYHWDVVVSQILADLDAGLVDGRNLTADYANGGLTIELNPGAGPSEVVRPRVEELVAAASAG